MSITDGVMGEGRQFFAGSATWGYLPRVSEVKQGTTVVFTNDGFRSHTVTAEITDGFGTSEFDSGVIAPGGSYSLGTSVLAPGEHPYFCGIHPWMTGIIRVDP